MKPNQGSLRRGEQGFALVLAILALMLLTFLGLTLATTTSTELQIATNYRWQQQALYNAEAGIEAGKVILARSGTATGGWTGVLPSARPGSWFESGAPEPLQTPADPLDYESKGCDTRGNMGYGRVLSAGGTTFSGVSTWGGQTLNGAFTLWVRRPLRTDADGRISDSTDIAKVILTAEGVAPFMAPAGGGAAAEFIQANQATRVLEYQLALDIKGIRKICPQGREQAGARASGDNFNPCDLISGSSGLGDASGNY